MIDVLNIYRRNLGTEFFSKDRIKHPINFTQGRISSLFQAAFN